MTFRLHAPWVHSLKEKRMVVKSLVTQLQNRFHVSAAEIDEQDTHQTIVIGVAVIVPHHALADSIMDEISTFVEANTEAEILDENQDAWLVSIPLLEYYNGEPAGGVAYIYRVDKKNGAVKFVTGAQDYWEGMIDITEGVVAEDAAETEYAE